MPAFAGMTVAMHMVDFTLRSRHHPRKRMIQ